MLDLPTREGWKAKLIRLSGLLVGYTSIQTWLILDGIVLLVFYYWPSGHSRDDGSNFTTLRDDFARQRSLVHNSNDGHDGDDVDVIIAVNVGALTVDRGWRQWHADRQADKQTKTQPNRQTEWHPVVCFYVSVSICVRLRRSFMAP